VRIELGSDIPALFCDGTWPHLLTLPSARKERKAGGEGEGG